MMDHLLDPDPGDTRACREDSLAAVRRAISVLEGADWSELDDDIFDEAISALEEAARLLRMSINIMEDIDVD